MRHSDLKNSLHNNESVSFFSWSLVSFVFGINYEIDRECEDKSVLSVCVCVCVCVCVSSAAVWLAACLLQSQCSHGGWGPDENTAYNSSSAALSCLAPLHWLQICDLLLNRLNVFWGAESQSGRIFSLFWRRPNSRHQMLTLCVRESPSSLPPDCFSLSAAGSGPRRGSLAIGWARSAPLAPHWTTGGWRGAAAGLQMLCWCQAGCGEVLKR